MFIFHFSNTELLNRRDTSVSFLVLQAESDEISFCADALNGASSAPLARGLPMRRSEENAVALLIGIFRLGKCALIP